MRKAYSLARLQELHAKGLSYGSVARILKISRDAVIRAIKPGEAERQREKALEYYRMNRDKINQRRKEERNRKALLREVDKKRKPHYTLLKLHKLRQEEGHECNSNSNEGRG